MLRSCEYGGGKGVDSGLQFVLHGSLAASDADQDDCALSQERHHELLADFGRQVRVADIARQVQKDANLAVADAQQSVHEVSTSPVCVQALGHIADSCCKKAQPRTPVRGCPGRAAERDACCGTM